MRSSARKLTKRMVESLRADGQEKFVWDSEVTGFGCRFSTSGGCVFVLQYRVEGRSRRYTIGGFGSPWTVETARARARELLGLVAGGEDPQASKACDRRRLSVAELCELYLAEGLATRKPSTVAGARSLIENHIKPLIGTRRAAAVLAEDVDRLMLDVAAGKTARRVRTGRRRGFSRVRGGKGSANRVVQVLSAVFSFGVRRRVRPDNPCFGVRKFPGKKLGRYLSPAELGRLGQALAAAEALGVESPYAIAALRLLMLTGCRKREVLTLKRSYVDAHNRCLRLPDSKTGAKVVHVGQPVLDLIAALPADAGADYLLPGRRPDRPMADLQSAWERIRAAAGLPGLRIHDLRHAFASVGASGGESLMVIGALLGHQSPKTTQRYAHLSDAPVKDAAGRISNEVANLLGLAAADDRKRAEPRSAPPAQTPPGLEGLLGAVVDTRWLDTAAAAKVLGNTVGTLQTWRWMGTGPRFRRIGRRIAYAFDDLAAWKPPIHRLKRQTFLPGWTTATSWSSRSGAFGWRRAADGWGR